MKTPGQYTTYKEAIKTNYKIILKLIKTNPRYTTEEQRQEAKEEAKRRYINAMNI